MANITLLPSAKVPLIYEGENTMTTEWYRFFWNIYGFTGTGVIPVDKGGTGLDTIGEHQLIIGNANNVFEPALLSSASILITYVPGYVNLELGISGVTAGAYGSASTVGQFTVNQYGILTAASNVSIGIDASQIISGTIASARISGSYTGITGVGTLTVGTWNASTIDVAYGGTGQTTYTNGQLLIGNTTGNTLTKATLTAGANITITNGPGSITIAATSTGGTVTSVSGTAPISVATGTTTPVISISQANTTTNGYLSSTDWNTFNNKGSGSVTSVAATAGTGISVTGSPITTSGTLNITNTAPDQTVVLTAGTGISTSGTYPNFTITNTSPSSGGTVTSVAATVPSIFSITGSPITTSGTLAMTYSGTALPVANGGTGLTSTPSNGQLDIGNGTGFTRSTLTAGAGITVTNGAGTITIAAIGGNSITSYTYTATQGQTVFTGLTYALGNNGLSVFVNGSKQITSVNYVETNTTTVTFTTGLNVGDLVEMEVIAAVAGLSGVTGVTGTAPIVSTGGSTPAISIPVATTSVNGYLSSTDWTTFNNKQAALVSGTNIKTVGGTSLLGSGDVNTIGNSTNAVNVGITDDTTTNSDYYVTFVTASSGNTPVKTSASKLKYNPSTGALTASIIYIAP